jgi:hypothetical protein
MEEQEKPVFDPRKKYTWAKEDQFVLSGAEFGVVLNGLRSLLSTKEAQNILMADESSKIMEKLLANSVESGVAKETK